MQGQKTYIIKTKSGEYYSGKTNNIDRRMNEHRNEKRPHWFAFKDRKDFAIIHIFNGDFEKIIKRMGVEQTVKLISFLAPAS